MALKDLVVSVFGLGLLGGSLAWKLKKDGAAKEVAGWSRRVETVRFAHEGGMIHRPCYSLPECAALADVVVLAVPLRAMESLSGAIRPHVRPSLRAVFDLGSAKGMIGQKLSPLWGPLYGGFHPMAGKERGGVENADPDLFNGAACAFVPFPETDPSVEMVARELAGALGGRFLKAGAAAHDGAAACISHLPVLIASALSLLAEEELKVNPLVSLLAAGGFRDTTRVAGGPPWLGADMAAGNREEIRRLGGKFTGLLARLLEGSPEELEALLAQGAEAREKILRQKNSLPDWEKEGT